MVVNIVVLSMNLIIPIVMLIIGLATKNHVPKNRYGAVGYRTARSRSSEEAWQYANKEMARRMLTLGVIVLVLTIVISVFFIKGTVTVVSIVVTVVMVAQCVALLIGMLGIEKQLKEKFDGGNNEQ